MTRIRSCGNSILKIKVFAWAELEIEDAREMREMLVQLANGNKYAVMLDASETFSITKDARELISGNEFAQERIVIAFYTLSLANRIIGNFFMGLNKPSVPAKLFNNENEAIAWLHQYLE